MFTIELLYVHILFAYFSAFQHDLFFFCFLFFTVLFKTTKIICYIENFNMTGNSKYFYTYSRKKHWNARKGAFVLDEIIEIIAIELLLYRLPYADALKQ